MNMGKQKVPSPYHVIARFIRVIQYFPGYSVLDYRDKPGNDTPGVIAR